MRLAAVPALHLFMSISSNTSGFSNWLARCFACPHLPSGNRHLASSDRMKISSIPFRKVIVLGCLTATAGVGGLFAIGSIAGAQQLILNRRDATILIEPYAPNVVRVSMSLRRD